MESEFKKKEVREEKEENDKMSMGFGNTDCPRCGDEGAYYNYFRLCYVCPNCDHEF